MKTFSLARSWVTSFALAIIIAFGLGSCGSGDSSPSGQYLVIPDGVFVPGKVPIDKRTTQAPVVTAPSSTTFTTNVTYTWTVNFSAVTEISVNAVIIVVEELNGYYVMPLEDSEISAGRVDIPMYTATEEPSSSVCERKYVVGQQGGSRTCYGPPSFQGTTEMTFAAANTPDEGVQYMGGVGMSAGDTTTVAAAATTKTGTDTSGFTCVDVTDSMKSACSITEMKSCCTQTGTQCKYIVNGSTIMCAGTDCAAAASTIVSSYCKV
jgi:hypothetical protein